MFWVITTPADATAFTRLLGDGAQFGISITYAVQPVPDGLARAFVLGKDHIGTVGSARARRQYLLWSGAGITPRPVQRSPRRDNLCLPGSRTQRIRCR